MTAKYYIYWNLHKNCYSVRFKGKVIFHLTTLVAAGVTFKVSQKGRERVLRERKKNVHAFVVADKIFPNASPWDIMDIVKSIDDTAKYNPYFAPCFVDKFNCPLYNAGMVWATTLDNKPSLRIPK